MCLIVAENLQADMWLLNCLWIRNWTPTNSFGHSGQKSERRSWTCWSGWTEGFPEHRTGLHIIKAVTRSASQAGPAPGREGRHSDKQRRADAAVRISRESEADIRQGRGPISHQTQGKWKEVWTRGRAALGDICLHREVFWHELGQPGKHWRGFSCDRADPTCHVPATQPSNDCQSDPTCVKIHAA